MNNFPEDLTASMIGAPATMLILVWVIFRQALNSIEVAHKKLISLLIAVILSGWLVGALVLSHSGFFLKLSLSPLPNIGLLFAPIVVGLNILAKSAVFKKIVANIYQPWLIGVQVTRVMGVVFLALYAQGLMPAEFAFPSGIGDILVGITAPVVALILFYNPPRGRKLAIVWNIIGFAELSLAIFLGFFTSPTPYQWLALNNPNKLLFDFPLALVPTFAVPLSLLLHIFSLRVLIKNKTS